VQWRSVHRAPPALAHRSTNSEVFETGIKAIDVLVPLERGGKAGLFGGAGVGKTVLLTEMIHTMIGHHEGIQLAKEQFIGMDRKLDLRNITCPTYLLAGANDDITTPEQVLDAARCLWTRKNRIVQKTMPAGHIGLFMGARTLTEDCR
jgi:pimeloyl-ACP methyl ester carboxylesterase